MLLGDVKAEALKLMGLNNELNITYLNISGYKADPTYASYLHSMVGAINRAFDRLYILGAIDSSVEINDTTPETFDLTEIGINNVFARMLPLFIVGDVFAIEEPNFAASQRNQFETMVEEYMNAPQFQQDSVDIVYGVD